MRPVCGACVCGSTKAPQRTGPQPATMFRAQRPSASGDPIGSACMREACMRSAAYARAGP
eukprot:336998-Prymnesium_polylepis.1